MRTAAYVRYSSDRQRETSAEDQIRILSALAASRGWPAPTRYSDPAVSGAHTDRPGLRRLIEDIDAGHIDALLLEDLSRLSRDMGDLAQLQRRIVFAGCRIVTAAGYDSDQDDARLRLGLEGIMGEAYLADLARRTHRGQDGAVLRGYSAGGRSYGYNSEPVCGPSGEILGYRRVIDQDEALVVRRIFRLCAEGESSYRIVRILNRDGIQGPRGKPWAISAVYPDRKRPGVGVLSNPIYRGDVIWNRSKWVRVPGTKKRRRIERPASEWRMEHDEGLRIVDDELWAAAQAAIERSSKAPPGPRNRFVLSGVLVCGTCGAGYTSINSERLGCSSHRNRGPAACDQSVTVLKDVAEDRILAHVKRDLLTKEAADFFCAEVRRIQAGRQPDPSPARARLRDAESRIANIIRAIEAGILTSSTKDALQSAERERDEAAFEIARIEQAASGGQLDPRVIHRRMVAAIGKLEGARKETVRGALADLLGQIEIIGTKDGPAAVMNDGRVLSALVANDGSGGLLWSFQTTISLATKEKAPGNAGAFVSLDREGLSPDPSSYASPGTTER